MSWQSYVLLDMGGIHEFIFGTDKLKEIRGGSILLDRLNRTEVVGLLDRSFGSAGSDYEIVLARGGNVKALFADTSKADAYMKKLLELFSKETPDMHVSIIKQDKEAKWSERDWMDHAEAELNRRKLFCKWTGQISASPYFKACQACGINPAEKLDDKRLLCNSCALKRAEASNYKQMEIYANLEKAISALDYSKLPNDFSDIGRRSTPAGYIGFIYADGNNMGGAIRELKTFKELSDFSKEVEAATFKAAIAAIKNNFSADYPFQIILAGGDDFIMALPADKALPVAADYCASFNNELSKQGITTSAGVVICHDSLPVSVVLRTAEGLLKNAKTLGRERGKTSCIDFSVISGAAVREITETRRNEYYYSDFAGESFLTMRPYSTQEVSSLIEAVKLLKKEDFPRNKLKALYGLLFKGNHFARIETSLLKTRLKQDHLDAIKKIEKAFSTDKFPPWREDAVNSYSTPFADIVELYDFVGV